MAVGIELFPEETILSYGKIKGTSNNLYKH